MTIIYKNLSGKAIKTPLINYKENIKLDKQKINGIIDTVIIIWGRIIF